MAAENPNFSARPEQVEGKWKSVFREMTEKNAHFTEKLQSSMVTGLMFARLRQAAALGRRITCALRPSHKKKKLDETEEEDRNEESADFFGYQTPSVSE